MQLLSRKEKHNHLGNDKLNNFSSGELTRCTVRQVSVSQLNWYSCRT